MAQHVPIYLQLPPQLGGTRFGPFTKRIDIGSDRKLNQIVLDSRQGIFPTHAVAVQTDTAVLTVQPARPQAQVFVIPNGQMQTWPVHGPVLVHPGDVLVFGTPAGPRFQVWVDPKHLKGRDQILTEAKSKGGEAGAMHALGAAVDSIFGAPKQGGIRGELQRRAQAELLTKGPGRGIYQLWTRARSGVLTSPRTIVALAIALFGLVTTGGLSCSGVILAFYRVVMY